MAEQPVKSDFSSGAEYAQALRDFQQEQARVEESNRIKNTYYDVGAQVTGTQQAYLDEIYAGYGTGKYSGADVENAMSILSGQAASGMFNTNGNSGGTDDTTDEFVPAADAKSILATALKTYGLESLSDVLWKKYTNRELNLENEDSIMFAIKDEDAYKKRFVANQARMAKGLSELTPSSYLALEQSYRKTLAANGLPTGFYDRPDDFQKLIEGDVSVSELNSRLEDAYSVIKDADQTVVNKLRTEYGIGEGDLVAYFVDPERARPLLSSTDYKRQAQASIFMARAENMANVNLQKSQAELLAQKGVTTSQAEKAFTTISQMNELRRANPGEMQLSDEELVNAALGTDTAAAKKLADIQAKRKAQFLGGGSYAERRGQAGEIKTGI